MFILIGMAAAALAAPPPLEISPYWTTSEHPVNGTGMIWRDCNNDGWIDGFFSNGNDITQSANTIYLNNQGEMPVSASWSSDNEEYSGHCAVGDINDDGYADFIVSNYIGDGFSTANRSDLYLNNGGLPETLPSWRTPDSIYSFSCALADVDLDGDLDVAFATGEGYYNHLQKDCLYLNVDGEFASPVAWESAAYTAAVDVTWGDVNNDGYPDLALCYDNRETSVYYNNGGTLETSPTWQASTVESGNTLIFGDVDGDGWLDLVVAYNNQLAGDGYFRVYFNDGTGNLSTTGGWESATGGYGSALALYDYDNDGDDDLAAGRWFTRLMVYENLGTTFTTSPVWLSVTDIVAEELAWVDIVGEGLVSMIDTATVDGSRHLFYTERHPLYAVDSIVADGYLLTAPDFCYDLVSGWVSLAAAPTSNLYIYYRYSYYNDLTVSCWDTVNMAFWNTNKPVVDFAADPVFGPAPLLTQFTDLSPDAPDWHWDFGDSDSSLLQNPIHDYVQPGHYSVSLAVNTVIGERTKTVPRMISAYADTMTVATVAGSIGSSVRVDVNVRNYLDLKHISIPFTWADGPLYLTKDSVVTTGLRTDYFDMKTQLNDWQAERRCAWDLNCGLQPYLEAGDGAVLSIWFTVDSGGGSCPVIVEGYISWEPEFETYAGVYDPILEDGMVMTECCIPPTVGDLDQSGQMPPSHNVDGADLSLIINGLFINPTSGWNGICLDEADIDLSGQPEPSTMDIDGADLSLMIAHLFISLDPLLPCP